MVFEKFRDLCESQSLGFFAVKGGLGQNLEIVTGALVLGEDVAPQFLVFSHELEHSFTVAVFLLFDLHKRKCLRLLVSYFLVSVMLLGK